MKIDANKALLSESFPAALRFFVALRVKKLLTTSAQNIQGYQMNMERSEIRNSLKIALLDKVRKQDYGKYLLRIDINKIRGFSGETVSFDFPVTALIGPNGSGKSSILGAAACAYKTIKPGLFFPKSAIGDNSMSG